MGNVFRKMFALFAGLGPKSRPFLTLQSTAINNNNKKKNMMNLCFFTLWKVCIEIVGVHSLHKK